MFESLPEDILRGIEAARKRTQRKGSRLSVHMGEAVFPILRLSEDGFSVASGKAPPLRGLVDIFDGPRHVSRALIVAASDEGGETTYEFKRATLIADGPVRDYVEDRPRMGLLPRLA